MQTFLPSSSFTRSAQILDNKRLGKQRIEAYQILCCLLEGQRGWNNHPAVLMWKGHEGALYIYTRTMCREWSSRGFKNTLMAANLSRIYLEHKQQLIDSMKKPLWLRNKKFHASHRSNLLRKNEVYYSQFNWMVSNDLPYVWPTKEKV